MTETKLRNDASASIKGTLYQLYVAVEKCFGMISGQKIIIERYGDITVSESQQLEIKHYGEPLTDNHLNFWTTLKNWMRDDFDETAYAALLLCTTQEIGDQSLLKDWNSKDMDGRIAILNTIHDHAELRERKRAAPGKKEAHKITESLSNQRWILETARNNKLRSVVQRFVIAHGSPDISNLYIQVKEKHAKGILRAKRDDFLGALLGFIICPKTVIQNSWEISYSDFESKVQEFTSKYCKDTRQFPCKYMKTDQPSAQAIVPEDHADKLFVKKILDIEYKEMVSAAIDDYLYASRTVLDDLGAYEVPVRHYEVFAKNVLDQYNPRYRQALRKVINVIKDSQSFYDEIMGEQPPSFPSFETPPLSFKNGVIHMHTDDLSKGIKWRLEPK
jgi:hypothetical protein